MLKPGDRIEIAVEKPAHGGRMIGRHDGRVVLALGAIPGERVLVRIDRVESRLAFASTEEVLDASADRRPAHADPLCGGCVYSHIHYARQLDLKGQVIADAFARIAHLPLDDAITVAASPERGYRMRARLHVRGGRAGFYREGTHTLCDAAGTGQLVEAAVESANQAIRTLEGAGLTAESITIAENLTADSRAVHVEALDAQRRATGRRPSLAEMTAALHQLCGPLVSGASARTARGARLSTEDDSVSDTLDALTGGRASGTLRRKAESFFQANRFLLPQLVGAVLDAVPADGGVLELYAGAGL
jgi:23S rRNA (uracil1939-C5)-methyltransferase